MIAAYGCYANFAWRLLLTLPLALWMTPAVATDDDYASLRVEASFIELRSGPSERYPIIAVLEQGETLQVIRARTGWLQLQDQRQRRGWFSKRQLGALSQAGQRLQHQPSMPPYSERQWEVGVMYGDMAGAHFYNVYADYALSSVFSIEASLGKALGSVADSSVAELMLIAQPFSEWPLSPYLGVGAGAIETEPHGVLADGIERRHTLIGSSAGVKYHFAGNVVLRAEYRLAIPVTHQEQINEIHTWKLGFSVFF
ncbi:SH3 domain-containing protein [Ferrimonas senticii]|uniref:SH3 domain-containing protein n=1 Tax=Ferrimonas senticii TaxID=394566 RepID=UPI0003FF99F3|nr:SH3 domain-containing protein [Ferrimonas senticii]